MSLGLLLIAILAAQAFSQEGETSAGQELQQMLKESDAGRTLDVHRQNNPRVTQRHGNKKLTGSASNSAPNTGAHRTESTSSKTPARNDGQNAETLEPPSGDDKRSAISYVSIGIGTIALGLIVFTVIKRRSTMKWFYDLKIGTKLIASFFLVALIAGFIGYTGVTNMSLMNDNAKLMYDDRTVPLVELSNVQQELYEIRVSASELVGAKSDVARAEDKTSIAGHEQKAEELLTKFASTSLSAEEKAFLDDYKKGWDEFKTDAAKLTQLALTGNEKAARDFETSAFLTTSKKISDEIDSICSFEEHQADSLDQEISKEYGSASLQIYAVLGIGIVLSISLGFFVARVISRPLKELAGQAEIIASGDLTVQVNQQSKDEVGQLAASFKTMVGNLRQTIGQVGEASAAVASASSQISSSTEEMSAGAQEQNSQASEVASAVEEMTKTIVENSRNASNTADTAKNAKNAAEEGGKVVDETVVGMKRIADVVNRSAETVKALGKSSDQIGEIIGVIDDIADQTNLLALNAAIEAARAGEQGRGFAVVADEVRKLAERTTKATKEIAGMIKTIQADTSGAVESMEEGTKEVDNGIKLADKAGASLKEIVGLIQNLTDMVSQIAAASEEQSSASEQISKNVEGISSVTNQSAAGIQQIARAAEDLNRLTENQQSLVAKFKLTGEGQHQGGPKTESSHAPKSHKTAMAKVAVRANGALVPHDEAA